LLGGGWRGRAERAAFWAAFWAALICFAAPIFEVGAGNVESVIEVVMLVFFADGSEEAGDSDFFGEEMVEIVIVDHWFLGLGKHCTLFTLHRWGLGLGLGLGLTFFALLSLTPELLLALSFRIRHDLDTLRIRMFPLMRMSLMLAIVA
jgi:uncharacterized membrane protein YhaH (DUF805 family)